MNEQGTIEALIAEYRADADMMDARELPLPTTGYLRILLNRVEAACRRAYKEIDALTEELDTAKHCWKVWSDRADELLSKCNEQFAKLKTLGNAAKLREAVKCLMDNLNIHLMQPSELITVNRAELDGMVMVCEKALAALAETEKEGGNDEQK